MSGSREKDQADFDLDRFVDMFDTAMTSDDPRVKNSLRQLMMMVILTDTGDHEAAVVRDRGPLRRVVDDLRYVNRRLSEVEAFVTQQQHKDSAGLQSYSMSSALAPGDTKAALAHYSGQSDIAKNLSIKINSGGSWEKK